MKEATKLELLTGTQMIARIKMNLMQILQTMLLIVKTCFSSLDQLGVENQLQFLHVPENKDSM